jgi:hypothetical protein
MIECHFYGHPNSNGSAAVPTERPFSPTLRASGAHAALCYSAIMRPGRTKTTSFSLDLATLKNLRALAQRRHKGNVSALLAEFAEREAKFLAAERLFEKYGIPPLDDLVAERIEAEWRGEAAPKKRRRRAA